jgi:hypothetical protein
MYREIATASYLADNSRAAAKCIAGVLPGQRRKPLHLGLDKSFDTISCGLAVGTGEKSVNKLWTTWWSPQWLVRNMLYDAVCDDLITLMSND